ncbi:type II toxin-antitoxin system death-on-curing family toxin [Angustibacter sp. McL0619]|uniref:type II toxin-antitoxin system death-on-curing family toxin n=1 Tax=Angustibacter sp. McL0619 TaxID=3415676 RepID=UPI003CF81FFD
MTDYLTLDDVLSRVARLGLTVKDVGLLDSAVQRCRSSAFGQDAYPTLAEKAAALLHSLAQNQPLVDGNKRIALLCAHAFLWINAHEIWAEDDALFDLMIDLASGLDDLPTIAERLRVVSVPRH